MKQRAIALPSIKHVKSLPVVLSQQEVKQVLVTSKLLKHRIVPGLLYGCGLRNAELCNLKITDVDMDRKVIHVRQGKGRKDRYVTLNDMMVRGIKKYLHAEKPDILPKRLVRIRHYGILSSTSKKRLLNLHQRTIG